MMMRFLQLSDLRVTSLCHVLHKECLVLKLQRYPDAGIHFVDRCRNDRITWTKINVLEAREEKQITYTLDKSYNMLHSDTPG